VVLMRKTAITHLVDGAQRSVVLPIVSRSGKTLTVAAPPRAEVAPEGPYLLFVNKDTDQGKVPSVAAEVTVDGAAPSASSPSAANTAAAAAAPGDASDEAGDSPARPAADLEAAGAVPVDAELAFHEIAEVSGHRHAGRSSDNRTESALMWLPVVAALLVTANLVPSRRRLLFRRRS
jgi:hypothetical protein